MKGTDDNLIEGTQRRFLTRAEIATLTGMLLCVVSLFLVWKYEPFSQETLHSMPGTLLVNAPAPIPITGFGLPLRWPLTLCAVLAGASLLFAPTPQNRVRMVAGQIVAAAVCVLIPLARFGLRPGVLAALLGGALLLYGALERYGVGRGQSRKEAEGTPA